MDDDIVYKGYTIRHIGVERIVNPIGYGIKVKTYYITNSSDNGVAKAWGLKQAKALVNADIRGEL